MFAQFLDLLDQQEEVSIEEAINDYPLMDIVMIYVMRSLLAGRGVEVGFHSRVETGVVFRSLAKVFRLRVAEFEQYWVFEDSGFVCS